MSLLGVPCMVEDVATNIRKICSFKLLSFPNYPHKLVKLFGSHVILMEEIFLTENK